MNFSRETPLWRTTRKPSFSSMRQISWPEKTPSLGIRRLEPRDEHLRMKTALDLFVRRAFEEKLDRFFQIGRRFFYRLALAGDIELRAERDVALAFALDDCGELKRFHVATLRVLPP